jgi:EF hand
MGLWNKDSNHDGDENSRKAKRGGLSEQQHDGGKEIDSTTESCSASFWSIDVLFSTTCVAAMPSIGTYIKQAIRQISDCGNQVASFLSPARPEWQSKARIFWEDAAASSPMDWMMKHFDTNGDGHISPSELVNMTDILKHLPHLQQESWTVWFRREWPLLDWKVGVFMWKSFGGILFVLTILTIIPGRLHGISARILRWPLLAIVHFLIVVELM